jgi:hypothetical protein
MNSDANRRPPDPAGEAATSAPAGEKEVIVFRGPGGEVLLVLPAADVAAIIPDRYLSRGTLQNLQS